MGGRLGGEKGGGGWGGGRLGKGGKVRGEEG